MGKAAVVSHAEEHAENARVVGRWISVRRRAGVGGGEEVSPDCEYEMRLVRREEAGGDEAGDVAELFGCQHVFERLHVAAAGGSSGDDELCVF